jgi:hypothetical protein
VTWKAADDNGDELVYRLSFRRADDALDPAAGGGSDDGWLPAVEDLTDSHYVFDATVLPDGVYRFRLEASDRRDNPPGEDLTAERVSEPVVVDHAAPRLVAVEAAGTTRLRVVVEDALNPLVRARRSTDAGDWEDVRPEDGLLDGRRESFLVEVPAGAHLLLLQVGDAAYNGVTFDLLHPPTP